MSKSEGLGNLVSRSYVALIVSLAAVGVTPSASADVRPLIAPGLDALSDALAPAAAVRPALASGPLSDGCALRFSGSVPGDLAHDYLNGGTLADNTTDSQLADVRELPPLPGSAALFVSAVLSMGGWHLVRSARHLPWGALPDWYHTGGPLQIGHAVPLDLDFDAVPPCWLESTADSGGSDRARLYHIPRGDGPRCEAQGLFLTLAAPRGPPASSC